MFSFRIGRTCLHKFATANYGVRKFGIFKVDQNFSVQQEVRNALNRKQPVVALESTIITHGMPFPENVETALAVEDQVRKNGAIPATIGIIDGRIKVGLTHDELLTLAQTPREQVIKCSRRDLPFVVAMKKSGGTTVAATMIVANRVGIKIFATGGIGGVHRGGHTTMDISADLVELGRTPVAVICSGIKSILDIPRTLEFLETQGVCVASYDSPGGVFPDFYTRDSGSKVPYNLISPMDAAELLRAWCELKLQSGVLIGVPIPSEFAADKATIDAAIEEANIQATAQDITGKEVTPFLLAAISRITQGSSLISNIELIKNNAAVAAQIACGLQKQRMKMDLENAMVTSSSFSALSKPIVIGASILDLSFTVNGTQKDMKLNGATYMANAKQTAGGVGRNIAEGIHKLYGGVHLFSAVGKDQLGQALLQMMPPALQKQLLVKDTHSTSLCSVIFDKTGECKLILGNMEIHEEITPDFIESQTNLFKNAPIIIMDSNISDLAMTAVLQQAQQHKVPVFFEPTDMYIAGKPFKLPRELTQYIRIISPNVDELETIVETITGRKVNSQPDIKSEKNKLLQHTKILLKQIESHFSCIIATLGSHGVLLSFRPDITFNAKLLLAAPSGIESSKPPHTMRFYAAPLVSNIANVSGAGDSFCAGFITALLKNFSINECVAAGFVAAERALQSDSAVPLKYFHDENAFESKFKETLPKLQQQII